MMKSYPGDDKARELVQEERWAEARVLLESVNEVFEGAAAMNDLALVLARTGERDRAFDLLEQAESRPDADLRVRLNRFFISELCEFDDSRGQDALKRVADLTRGDASLKPKLSIIMRTFNRSHLIAEAIQSVRRQKFQDWELVIVNDGGDREVDKIVERNWDQRMVYAYALHSGPAGAFNVGLRLSRGPLFSFLDDDDLVYPDHYYRLVSHLEAHPEVKAVYTDLKLVWLEAESGRAIREKVHQAGAYEPGKLWGSFYIMNLLTMVLRRELLEQTPGFLEGLKSAVDWEFMLALSRHCSFAYLPELGGELRFREGLSQVGKRSVLDRNLQRNLVLYYYGKAPLYSWSVGKTESSRKFLDALSAFLKEQPGMIPGLELRKLFREPEYALLYQLGRELEREGNWQGAWSAFRHAFRLAPYETRIWGRALRSWLRSKV